MRPAILEYATPDRRRRARRRAAVADWVGSISVFVFVALVVLWPVFFMWLMFRVEVAG